MSAGLGHIDFRRQENVLADVLERLADDRFAFAIDAGRVEIANSPIVGVPHHGHALVGREQLDAVGADKLLDHGRAAHREDRQLPAGLAERPHRNRRMLVARRRSRFEHGAAPERTAAPAPARTPDFRKPRRSRHCIKNLLRLSVLGLRHFPCSDFGKTAREDAGPHPLNAARPKQIRITRTIKR